MASTTTPMTPMLEVRNFIDGQQVEAANGETAPILDPTTGEAYAEAPVSGPEDIERACAAAAGAFEKWRDATPAERSLALLRIADAVEARAEELLEAE
ncbi:MAG TPA: aldehyde dehydrogenase family protein, partial [Solirubrobacteraceae bacterium]|nr:aldehyde dehydrogenase family protein [Solirubrobacteraceae bacterium]